SRRASSPAKCSLIDARDDGTALRSGSFFLAPSEGGFFRNRRGVFVGPGVGRGLLRPDGEQDPGGGPVRQGDDEADEGAGQDPAQAAVGLFLFRSVVGSVFRASRHGFSSGWSCRATGVDFILRLLWGRASCRDADLRAELGQAAAGAVGLAGVADLAAVED